MSKVAKTTTPTSQRSLPVGAYHVRVIGGKCPGCGSGFRFGIAPSATEPAVCKACYAPAVL